MLGPDARIYRSATVYLDCSAFSQPTKYESYLLSEGDGLVLDCNVCAQCFKGIKMCKAGESYGDWFIQRGRLGSGQGDLKGYVQPNRISAEYIRLRKNVTSFTSVLSRVQSYPKHVTMRVNEGERLVITCPVRNSPEKPITWFYAPDNNEELMELTKTAYNLSIIRQYGSSTRYLATKLKQIDFTTLIKETRGRYKLDSAYNIIVAETVSIRNEKYKGLHHLICVHGDACAVRYDNNKNNSDDLITINNDTYGEWSGIIHIDTIPRSGFVIFLSKLTPVVQLLIPFILALGLFFIVILTLYTERKPKMRLAANGMTIK
uniref:Ig-like domain-containing protein n=1 Tax=Trichobilharzia regenti TaxID=157069 RepID=A0AA85JAP5_TRIRE|nr:unnamed protein product [Trichobilharzia regenti]